MGGEGGLGGNASQALSTSTSNSQNENTSKYRQNKMTGAASNSKTPGGPAAYETNSVKYTVGNTSNNMRGNVGGGTNLNSSLIT